MMEHAQWLLGGLLLAVALLVAWVCWMLPEWSRPGIYFAVTVEPAFRATLEARRIFRGYRLQAMIHVAISLALLFAGLEPKRWPALIVGELWLVVGPLIAFLIGRERVMPHAAKPSLVREALLAPRAAHLPGGWLLQLGPFAILAGTALYLRWHWEEIPERFPVHWGVDGRPNGWSMRTPAGVYTPLLLGAAIVAGMALLTYGLLRETRLVRAPGSGKAHLDLAHQAAYFLAGIEYFLATILSAVALLPLTRNFGAGVVLIAAILLVLAIFPLAHRLNRARTPYASVSENSPAPVAGDGTLDEHWRLGVLYFNPEDSALFVEKRFGIGYTLNFARGTSWFILLMVLALPVALAFAALWRH